MMKRDMVVIGGGLSGLTAAVVAAQAGHSVVLVERNEKLGGRASSETMKGSVLNMGAHALYRKGAAAAVMQELGIPIHGGTLPVGGTAVMDGKLFTLPVNAGALLTSKLLTWGSKIKFAKLLTRLKAIDTLALGGVSWLDWVAASFPHDRGAQQMMLALGRLWTYADGPEHLSAGAVIKQGQTGLDGVYYLHGGWQSLIDSLRKRAEMEGVTIIKGKADAVLIEGDAIAGVMLAGEKRLDAQAVIAAVAPDEAIRLLGKAGGHYSGQLMKWKEQLSASYASCLDITVKKLPQPKRTFALHMDRPLYYSNHSKAARLNADGHQVVHLLKYQMDAESIDAQKDRRELESWMSMLQPGWRNEIVAERFIPKALVANAMPVLGKAGRPSADDTGVRGLFVSGDWVGEQGMLADAAVASAKEAAHYAIRLLRQYK